MQVEDRASTALIAACTTQKVTVQQTNFAKKVLLQPPRSGTCCLLAKLFRTAVQRVSGSVIRCGCSCTNLDGAFSFETRPTPERKHARRVPPLGGRKCECCSAITHRWIKAGPIPIKKVKWTPKTSRASHSSVSILLLFSHFILQYFTTPSSARRPLRTSTKGLDGRGDRILPGWNKGYAFRC